MAHGLKRELFQEIPRRRRFGTISFREGWRMGVFLLALDALLWGGCSATREVTSDMDHVLGGGYAARARRYGVEKPSRLLLLPVRGDLGPERAKDFLRGFETEIGAAEMTVRRSGEESPHFPSREMAAAHAAARGCDGILYIDISEHHPYPPIRVVVRMVVENLRGETVLEMDANYDGRNRAVANSARRYCQRKLQKIPVPNRSLIILSSDRLFLDFAAYDAARAFLGAFEDSAAPKT